MCVSLSSNFKEKFLRIKNTEREANENNKSRMRIGRCAPFCNNNYCDRPPSRSKKHPSR